MENRLNKLKAEVERLFNEIDPKNTPLFNEILLILRLSRAKGWTSKEAQLLNLIESMKGDSTFYEWDIIIDECKTYLTEQPFPSEGEFLYEFDYFSKLIDATPLAQFERINVENLVSKLPSSTNLAELNVYLSYAFMTGFPTQNQQGDEYIEAFVTQVLLLDNSLYPYIPAHEILDMDFDNFHYGWRLNRFNKTVDSLKQIFDDAKRFDTFFEELTGETYQSYHKRVVELQNVSDKSFEVDLFVDNVKKVLETDEQVLNLVTEITRKPNRIGEFPKIDLAIVTNQSISHDTSQMLAYARKIGKYLSGHSLVHVGKPHVLSCLYIDPFLRVDISFVTPETLHFVEMEEPILRMNQNKELQNTLYNALETRSQIDGQWYEDRFWFWIYDALIEIGNEQYLQAADRISYLRTVVFRPLLAFKNNGFPRFHSRKKRENDTTPLLNIENVEEQFASTLTSPLTLEAPYLLNYLKEMVELYKLLRIHLFDSQISYQAATEYITMNYFEKIEKR